MPEIYTTGRVSEDTPGPPDTTRSGEVTLLLVRQRAPPLVNPGGRACSGGKHISSRDASPSTLSHPRSGCLSFPQEVHLKYASRDGLLAALNLFQASQQLSNSKGGHGEKRTNAFVIFGTQLRIKKKVKRRFWLGLTQALGIGAGVGTVAGRGRQG